VVLRVLEDAVRLLDACARHSATKHQLEEEGTIMRGTYCSPSAER
jgi:hypothetical protein